MKKTCLILTLSVLASVISGCGPHAFMQLVPRYDMQPSASVTRAPHTNKVFITEQSLDPSSYDLLGTVDVTKVWYGSRSSVLRAMADMGRKMGADAVIDAKVWFTPVGWAWASPQGSGKAVVLKNDSGVDFKKSLGEYW